MKPVRNDALKQVSILSNKNGYEFNLESDTWVLSRERKVKFSWAYGILSEYFLASLRKALGYYAVNYSADYTFNLMERVRVFLVWRSQEIGLISEVTVEDLISYRFYLTRDREWYLGSIASLLKKWGELGISGLSSDIPHLLKSWTLKGNEKGVAVQTKDPLKGPLTDLEYESLQQALVDSFEVDQINLEDFVLVTLFMATGRRPAQLADLKAKDLIIGESADRLREYLLNVPRRKQRATGWRGEFKPVALTAENGMAVYGIIKENEAKLKEMFPYLPETSMGELPVFPNWHAIKALSADELSSDLLLLLKGESFHRPSTSLRTKLDTIVKGLTVASERTGQQLRVFPTRLRRTLATRAAREGYGSLIIAELLDHTDDQNARVYTENVPEHVDAINEAVARQLAPLAQTFAGVLVDDEKDAIRGNDLKSRVRIESGEVAGTCGHHGFCGALAPIACYTCKLFQPWLDGPHQEVLDGLLAERARIQEITQDNAITTTNDRTIFAVSEVILRCEARRRELNLNG